MASLLTPGTAASGAKDLWTYSLTDCGHSIFRFAMGRGVCTTSTGAEIPLVGRAKVLLAGTVVNAGPRELINKSIKRVGKGILPLMFRLGCGGCCHVGLYTDMSRTKHYIERRIVEALNKYGLSPIKIAQGKLNGKMSRKGSKDGKGGLSERESIGVSSLGVQTRPRGASLMVF